MRGKGAIYQIILGMVFILSFFTDWYAQLTLVLFISLFVMTMDNLGKAIVLREIISLHSCFVCLVMPLAGYIFFPVTNPLARIWVRWMPIPIDQYFAYALPAVSGFIFALCLPLTGKKHSDHGEGLRHTMAWARRMVQEKAHLGAILLLIGVVTYEIRNYLPTALQFAFLLFFFAGFAGLLYVYYAKSYRYRKLVLGLFIAFMAITTVDSGMFTIVANMGMTLLSFFFLGRKTALWKKLSFAIVAIFLLVVVQMVKPAFRGKIWQNNYQGNKALLFANMFADRVSNFTVESADVFFPVYYRTNQGFNVSLVMRRFPAVQPFDNGAHIGLTIVSAFVPRFLWPDKPEAGGKFNMQYYTGIRIVNFSTNVGPLGEAWGSFGAGGILFMVILGLFIRLAYRQVFVVASRMPLLLFWLPLFFYQVTYSAETDTLQIMNSLVKSAFFVFLLFKIKPSLFIAAKDRFRRPGRVRPGLSGGNLPAEISN
ncbi:MAG TPA: hypothetical protein VHE54_02270 [Puia sp.]|nr:hypothetical protein [Puia sp.]